MTTPTPSPESEALPTLPVVAWREFTDFGGWHTYPNVFAPEGKHCENQELTPQAPAEAAIVALRAEVAELRKERDALIQAGAPMANTMFNLAQKFDPVLFTRRDCELFRIMQVNWDAARASLLGDGGTL